MLFSITRQVVVNRKVLSASDFLVRSSFHHHVSKLVRYEKNIQYPGKLVKLLVSPENPAENSGMGHQIGEQKKSERK